MTCLIDYILLQGVTIKMTPNSGLYLNRELTIPLKNISSFANDEQVDLEGIWNDVQVKALRKFVVRLKLGMQELFQCAVDVDDDWICDNKDALTVPWMYFLGSELMLEVLHTSRINRFTTIDKHRAGEMKDEFDSEFQLQLKSALVIINSTTEAETETGQIFTYVEVIP